VNFVKEDVVITTPKGRKSADEYPKTTHSWLSDVGFMLFALKGRG
jgi:hypothetical protein